MNTFITGATVVGAQYWGKRDFLAMEDIVGITSLGHRAHALADAVEQAVLAAIAGTGQSPAPLPWFLVERAST